MSKFIEVLRDSGKVARIRIDQIQCVWEDEQRLKGEDQCRPVTLVQLSNSLKFTILEDMRDFWERLEGSAGQLALMRRPAPPAE